MPKINIWKKHFILVVRYSSGHNSYKLDVAFRIFSLEIDFWAIPLSKGLKYAALRLRLNNKLKLKLGGY